MKEHPILFSGAMVRAILDGSKTVTRRLIKFRRHLLEQRDDGSLWPWLPEYVDGGELHACDQSRWMSCPYGVAGDRLWVRETFAIHSHPQEGQGCGYWIQYKADGATVKGAWNPDPPTQWESRADRGWRPSIHMPRWASRLTLEVVSVRVEQLQDITEEDAIAEGCCGDWVDRGLTIGWEVSSAVEEFAHLWNEINGKRAPWESNPWVWRIEFRRAEA